MNLIKKKNIPLRKFRPIDGENWVDVYVRSHEFLNDLIVKYLNPSYSNEKFEEFKLQHNSSMKNNINTIKEEESSANNLFQKSKSSNMENDGNNKLILKENVVSTDLFKHKHKKHKIVIIV